MPRESRSTGAKNIGERTNEHTFHVKDHPRLKNSRGAAAHPTYLYLRYNTRTKCVDNTEVQVSRHGGWPRSPIETQPRVPHLRRSLIAAKVGNLRGSEDPDES